jgi:hypothetical protein
MKAFTVEHNTYRQKNPHSHKSRQNPYDHESTTLLGIFTSFDDVWDFIKEQHNQALKDLSNKELHMELMFRGREKDIVVKVEILAGYDYPMLYIEHKGGEYSQFWIKEHAERGEG